MRSTTFTRIAKEAAFHDAGHGFDIFGLHPSTLASAAELARPIYDAYFRVDSAGIEHIPPTGPAILVANHAGVLPVDAAMLCLDVLRRTTPPRIPRPVADHFIPRLPLVSTLFARLGVVSGTRANVRRLLESGELIAIWPEGVSGPAKPFSARYQLQRWSVGFAELAIRYGAPIVPVAIIGAEESWPVLVRLPGIRSLGIPYMPLPASPVPLPAHYHIRYGAPIRIDRTPADARDPDVVAAAAIEIRTALAQQIEAALAVRAARKEMFL